MDCIDLFKRAAVALQTDSRYLVLDQTRKANDKDEELQNLIGEFNLARMDLNCVMNDRGELIELQGTGEGRAFTVSEQQDLVRLCAENGVEVLSIPGCCAAVNALAVSGLPTGRFTFEGFLTVNKKSRRERLDSLKNEERTMIFHEAPHKLRATLEDLRETFGPDRRVALCRELTKLHEETVRTTLGEAAAYYQENTPKGEYVLVVAGSPPRETAAVTLEEGTEQVLRLVAQGIRLKDAAREVSAHTGLSKNELYAAALERS